MWCPITAFICYQVPAQEVHVDQVLDSLISNITERDWWLILSSDTGIDI